MRLARKPFHQLSLTSQEIGKRFERDLEACFRGMGKMYGFKWHRFTDTHEAGNVVRSQPSDYLITTSRGLAFMEAKASMTLSRFRPSLLRPDQKGAIRHYAQMLGMPYYVLFRDDVDQRVDVLDGKLCLQPKPTPLLSVRGDLAVALVAQWGLEPIKSVLRRFELRYGDAT